ncbi:hypothetical protein AG1IA_01420 [Rhizoctonia solani AG-1 IA]|uniref:Uncharacterized protein n=1 Tax=Thanatephorus cucumeris (strain AG1-IA) TaxID=983506 RepID=L8X2W8_THACA|nr:hypothetical protein AG1IA_01420 [Rhizoctonia solani AG-1 IA]
MIIIDPSAVFLATLVTSTWVAPTPCLLQQTRIGISHEDLTGGCPRSAGITTCYVARLPSKLNENLDDGIRGSDMYTQSNFMIMVGLEATGATTKFTFKYFIDSALKSLSAYEMKMTQVVSEESDADGSLTKV